MSEDAFYVVNLGSIVNKYQLWKEQLPRVDPFYAVKFNDSECVLQVLAKLGAGFDCASKIRFLDYSNKWNRPSKDAETPSQLRTQEVTRPLRTVTSTHDVPAFKFKGAEDG